MRGRLTGDGGRAHRPAGTYRLLLLRHGEVPSHRGDLPVTGQSMDTAEQAGRRLSASADRIRVLTGDTLRARQTGDAIATGARHGGAVVDGPRVAFALRNPDMYVAGDRVNMVSSAAALAEQVPGFTEREAAAVPFFATFFDHPDRVGWWLRLADVPGDDAATVAARIDRFAASLPDRAADPVDLVVGVTHSPVLRACALAHLGHDPGEPEWVTGLEITVAADRAITVRRYP
jgi:broad specificity phosphatase PhoE